MQITDCTSSCIQMSYYSIVQQEQAGWTSLTSLAVDIRSSSTTLPDEFRKWRDGGLRPSAAARGATGCRRHRRRSKRVIVVTPGRVLLRGLGHFGGVDTSGAKRLDHATVPDDWTVRGRVSLFQQQLTVAVRLQLTETIQLQ